MKTQLISATLAVLLVTAGLSAPVAADGDGMFEFKEDEGSIDQILSYVGGLADRIAYSAQQATGIGADETNVSTHAQNAEEVLKKHDTEFVSYANQNVPDSVNKTDYNSFKICLTKDGDTTHRYVESPVNNSSYTNLTVDQTANQTVDKTLYFDGYQVTQLDDILTHVHSNYVSEDKAPNNGLIGYLGGKLGRDYVSTSVEAGDASC